MGLVGSKQRVKSKLKKSEEFSTACDSAFSYCTSLTQHSFPGLLPYQLPSAASHIHRHLHHHHHHLLHWAPLPPSQPLIDSALRFILKDKESQQEQELVIGPGLFRDWALVCFTDSIVDGACKAVLTRVPLGVAGIVGAGVLARSGTHLVGAAVGVYALAVATSIYLSL